MKGATMLATIPCGTRGTAELMAASDIEVTPVAWPREEGHPNALDLLREGRVDLVVNIPKDARAAVDHGVPLITNIQLAQRLAQALRRKSLEALEVKSWREY